MKRRHWTPEEVEQLRREYPDRPTPEVAKRLGRKPSSVSSKASDLGVRKSAKYLASPAACRLRRGDDIGAATRFRPGQAPWNKGVHYVAGGRSAETRFRAGNRTGKAARLYQPVGTERITKDGYRQVKVNDDMPLHRRWRAKHLLLWEQHHGPLPPSHAVRFVNGDKADIRIDNLELVSRKEMMGRNTVHNLPKPLAELVQLRGAIQRQINKRERNEK